MPQVQYGNRTIDYQILEKEGLRTHYITVERGIGVILKGEPVGEEKSNKLVLKKARWIIEKLNLVRSVPEEDIVTGSRIPYLGRKYYVQFITKAGIEKIKIDFTASKFKVYGSSTLLENQFALKSAFVDFMRLKAVEKIAPRVFAFSKSTGLKFNELKFRKLEKRWGSCTAQNNIIINYEAIHLPFSLIDYLIVHELVHTQVKNHSKEFWAELSHHVSNWRELDARIEAWGL